MPLSTPTWPAPSNALIASVGRAVSTTDAAIVRGKSASSFSSGIALFRPVGSSRFGEQLGDGEAMLVFDLNLEGFLILALRFDRFEDSEI